MSDDHSESAKASDGPATEPSVENDAVPPTEGPDLGFHPINQGRAAFGNDNSRKARETLVELPQ